MTEDAFRPNENFGSAIRAIVIQLAVINYLQAIRSTELIICDIGSSEIGREVEKTKEKQNR
jgi:hypothetical protein